jgi:cephalosporin hydroxylase
MEPSFAEEVRRNIKALGADASLRQRSLEFLRAAHKHRYSYNFTWLGRPIIQYPADVLALQEVIWSTRPDLIVETGVAHGGSLVLHASILELLRGRGLVVGIDVALRPHNRRAIEEHPLSHRIVLVEGSSTDAAVLDTVREAARGAGRVMVMLDSMHTHDHVLREMELYGPLVTPGCYLVVQDTVIEDMPGAFPGRPWGPGNNPRTAVQEFLKRTDRFVVDEEIGSKLLVSGAPDGYLRCVREA